MGSPWFHLRGLEQSGQMLLQLRLCRPLLDGLMMDAIGHPIPSFTRSSIVADPVPRLGQALSLCQLFRELYFGIIILILQTLKHLIFALVLAANLSEREIPSVGRSDTVYSEKHASNLKLVGKQKHQCCRGHRSRFFRHCHFSAVVSSIRWQLFLIRLASDRQR